MSCSNVQTARSKGTKKGNYRFGGKDVLKRQGSQSEVHSLARLAWASSIRKILLPGYFPLRTYLKYTIMAILRWNKRRK